MSNAYLFFHEKECEFEDPHPAHFWGEITLTSWDEARLLRQYEEKGPLGGTTEITEEKRKAWGTRHTKSCSGKGQR